MASVYPDYDLLTPSAVPGYIAAQPTLARLVDPETAVATEVGDGNLNLVFVCRDSRGSGLCLKQALPYVRLVGASWPLTPDRAAAEARSLTLAQAAAPETVPTLYAFDHDRFILAMQDLSDWTVWRTVLNRGEILEGVADAIGRYVARMTFASSFGIEGSEMRVLAAAASNPHLARITEDLVFTEPYIDHPRNSFDSALDQTVESMRQDEALLSEVSELKYRFMTVGEALIHGDLHTGSVMVRAVGSGADARVIDPEFSCFGPVGFDLGAVIGNLLLAQARAHVLGRGEAYIGRLQGHADVLWEAFRFELESLWPRRADRHLHEGHLARWLEGVWADAVGFAGCKAVRRIVGLAKASDVAGLPTPLRVPAAAITLMTATTWIRERSTLTSPIALREVFGRSVEAVAA